MAVMLGVMRGSGGDGEHAVASWPAVEAAQSGGGKGGLGRQCSAPEHGSCPEGGHSHRLEPKWLRKEELYVAVNCEVDVACTLLSGAQGPGPKARDPIGA